MELGQCFLRKCRGHNGLIGVQAFKFGVWGLGFRVLSLDFRDLMTRALGNTFLYTFSLRPDRTGENKSGVRSSSPRPNP